MDANYEPRGTRVLKLLAVMRADPSRVFTSQDCARVMDCKPSAVGPSLEYAVRARLVYKRNTGRRCEYSMTEMAGAVILKPARKKTKHPERMRALDVGWATDPDDPRIGKVVPGWKPPVMRCVREGV